MLWSAFKNLGEIFPNKLAVVQVSGSSRTYSELFCDIATLRNRLMQAGVREGQPVATWLDNSLGYVSLIFALASIGAVHCPISRRATNEYIKQRINEIAPVLFVCADDYLPPFINTPTFLLHVEEPAPFIYIPDRIYTGIFRMQETSGSTGRPKLALWRQDRLYSEIQQWIESANLKADDRYLNIHTLDGGHAVDLHVFPALLTGATLFLSNATSAQENLELLEQLKISVISALPHQYLELSKASATCGIRLPYLALPFCGGAYLSNEVVRTAYEQLGIKIKRIYGSTEFGMILANFEDVLQVDCGMLPIGDVSVELDTSNTKNHLVGEIIVRSSHCGSGYYASPYPADYQVDGYRTGDIAKKTSEGYFLPMGRTSDVLVTASGIQFVGVLENFISSTLDLDLVVILPREQGGTTSQSIVIVQAQPEDWQRLRPCINSLLKDRQITAKVEFIVLIPKTPTGKPDRALLPSRLSNVSSTLYDPATE
ncbi:class I adenylate-forming enzyme family protein [Glaciimonas immobilis]|uniref:Yersiniabactin salicyl-AMP ligase n=1 Tax=Glaciimonas immobilis TaxID=728004 RepID=A0A840RYJ2_9BURK|nr:class I adenylate-forming enzyme family protein [Glaciimonas immobilis]KAF3996232.1 acyl--CoA ligase [Glaciimonas immobilis]MBB5202613.1 yersiniabactin salicyl-AMP ligase [Glaciimonas immobilis]